MKWDELHLQDSLLRGIYAYGFENPSNIQETTILPILNGRDVIAQAQSGSGKTGAFLISALHKIDTSLNSTQCLILVPTHELVAQTMKVATGLSFNIPDIRIKNMMGGTSIREDSVAYRNNPPHLVIGTVGRVLDMILKRILKVDDLKLFVLDEADEMLGKGFSEKINTIICNFPKNTQLAFFSATVPENIIRLCDYYMKSPEKILVKKEELSLQCITQYYVAMSDDNMKYEKLKELFSVISINKCIIYCNHVNRVLQLYNEMKKDDFSVSCIHGHMEKSERRQIYQQFCHGETRVLISSDITARGLDVQQVSIVINFDITPNIHTYLHRIGRSGRWGRKGWAINFITKYDVPIVREIESHYKILIEELPTSFNQLI